MFNFNYRMLKISLIYSNLKYIGMESSLIKTVNMYNGNNEKSMISSLKYIQNKNRYDEDTIIIIYILRYYFGDDSFDIKKIMRKYYEHSKNIEIRKDVSLLYEFCTTYRVFELDGDSNKVIEFWRRI